MWLKNPAASQVISDRIEQRIMIPVEEARARILASVSPTMAETVSIAEAHGRVLAVSVQARVTQPPHDVSAMDGYAVRCADAVAGARLTVIGAAPAGHPFSGSVETGQAVRLFTGSVVPQGSDTILLQEEAQRQDDIVIPAETIRPDRHIRRQGQDFTTNQTVLESGRILTARDIGLAAAANSPWLAVHRRPRVAILATGDEIVLPGEPVPPGGIVSSNSHMLAAMIRAAGGDPILLPLSGDDSDTIRARAEAATKSDLLITIGGASVGDHDLVRSALGERGLTLDFWKIAMRPGKPLMHGQLAGTPLIGLPGNPVSAYVCALLFVLPALEVLRGLPDTPLRTQPARLVAPLRANDHRTDFMRGIITQTESGPVVESFPVQDSSMISALARANALIMRAPHAPQAAAGEIVPVLPLESTGL
ncbi:Molybdopterin biosynthesis MoeA protein [Granulibacter bethesdensis CGDNIH1]|uniref:Molybdopterin molybdenumtransferase n=2 Tax=Granulibacter bethesdensis TaxID=364410 RepID=Q0BTY7_GRABC|nr:Molybdopterin biosynthesis MoeA protein [Granulibacter bethesdensis CGDNIH1]APH51523.1 Molybdopterin biosynthesis MoeA protein [Granulibacter bethesdensis]APH64216.1 Molybdopterin biosynthesis MoeA protein [Granulibacter bethesdensis]